MMINLLSGDLFIHPWFRDKYTVRKKLQKSMIFLEDEIVRICEHHRMHAVQIDGQWRIDASVLSPFTRDFKTMPLWFQKAIINKDREKIIMRETPLLSRPI